MLSWTTRKSSSANVSKLRAACYLADRPNAGCSRCQALVYFDVTAIGEFNAGQLQSYSFRVRSPSQQRPEDDCLGSVFSWPFCSITSVTDCPDLPDTLLSFAFRTIVDTFVLKEMLKSFRDIVVFPMHQPIIAIEHRHFASEPAHRLS